MYPTHDTIAAVSTASGPGGISIVRISGPRALEVGSLVFQPRSSGKGLAQQTRTLIHGYIINTSNREILDEVLAVFFKGPKSYTGEDTVEIQGHAGPAVTKRVLDLVLAQGVRHALPGEFSFRALVNGRLDLSQTEAVAQLVDAQSQAEARLAMAALTGGLASRLSPVRHALVAAAAAVEAGLDFPDELAEITGPETIQSLQEEVVNPLIELLGNSAARQVFRDGALVVICGRPNVGKSRLFNTILGQKRTIVTPTPGTTRDTVEESVILGCVVCRLVDTAGLGSVRDELDALGQERARQRVTSADLALVVLDSSADLTPADQEALSATQELTRLVVVNKTDLPSAWEISTLELGDTATCQVSAKSGHGMADLVRAIANQLTGGEPEPRPGEIVASQRQAEALRRCLEATEQALDYLRASSVHPEIASLLLGEALAALSEVDGQGAPDEVFEAIFSRFCVGK